MSDFIGWMLAFVLLGALNVWLVKFLWCGIRSIFKKTPTLPPSKFFWYRTRAEVVPSDEDKGYQVQYFYEDEEYTATIGGFSVYGNKAIIYVKRSDPTVVKEYIPRPPLSFPVALSYFFIAGMILLIEFMLFFG